MFMFAFFAAVFSSASWLIYAAMFIHSQIGDISLNEQAPETLLMYIAFLLFPVAVIWMVFGYINQFSINRAMNRRQTELLRQLQKNQDYTDLVVRVMLDAEHEIKDGFVLNKFDIFISDMNEALGEIIQRCNIASSAQLEQLWQRVRRGEKWTLGKAILDASKNQSTFDAWVREKVNRDKVFRGSLLEFCSRYQNLLQLLEKHDRDRVFLRMIESGVFGKVYSIIAPLSEGLQPASAKEEHPQKDAHDYASVLKVATIEEPRADETIINVDKNDDDEDVSVVSAPRQSFFSRINPFRHHEEEDFNEEVPEDPFFKALHSSFKEGGSVEEHADLSPSPQTFDTGLTDIKEDNYEPSLNADFGNSRNTLDSLRQTNVLETDNTVSGDELSAAASERVHFSGSSTRQEPSLMAPLPEKTQLEKAEDDDDLVYPFGGWTDEKNYHQ